MKIDYARYYNAYYHNNEYSDNWASTVNILPFTTNTQSFFDIKCGIKGVIGEFFRKYLGESTTPINSFEDIKLSLISHLKNEREMNDTQIGIFLKIVEDVLFVNNEFNAILPSFLEYLPMITDSLCVGNEKKKYCDGQKKIADYLFSMTTDSSKDFLRKEPNNLFTDILKSSLRKENDSESNNRINNYLIPGFVKKSFGSDFAWLLDNDSAVIVKYIHLFFYFYLSYALTQSIINLDSQHSGDKPSKLFFIMKNEVATQTCDAVKRGWMAKVSKFAFERLFGQVEALDIVNASLGNKIGFYSDIKQALSNTSFLSNKEDCEKILSRYQVDKQAYLKTRKDVLTFQAIDPCVSSYDEFFIKIRKLCMISQPETYKRIKQKAIAVLGIRFLKLRRNNYVLTIDNEMLVFLIGLFTRGKRVRLDCLYEKFEQYGICFSINTKNLIEELLLELNLLEQESDSGDAQYVRVVL